MSNISNTKDLNPSNNHTCGGIFFNFSIGHVGEASNNFLYISRSSAIDLSLPPFSSLFFHNFPAFMFNSDIDVLLYRFSYFLNHLEISLLLGSFLDHFSPKKAPLSFFISHFISHNLQDFLTSKCNIADFILSHHRFLSSLSSAQSSLESSFFSPSDTQSTMQPGRQFNQINCISNHKISNNFNNNFDQINQKLDNNNDQHCQNCDHNYHDLNLNFDQYCQNFYHNNNDLNLNSNCNNCNIEHQCNLKTNPSNHNFSLQSGNIIPHKSKQFAQKSSFINSKSTSHSNSNSTSHSNQISQKFSSINPKSSPNSAQTSNQINTKIGLNLEQSNSKSESKLDNLEQILTPNSTHFDQQYLSNLLALHPSKLKKFLIDNLPNPTSLRSHYRIKISFEHKIDTLLAINLAKEYLVEHFPDARFVAACHQNTDNTHVHVLLLATNIHGKKLHFSNSIYKKLDVGWAKIYAKNFGLDKLQQHLDKKQQTLDWKKHKMMGIEHQQPQRVKHPSKSLSNSIQQPTSSLIQQSSTPLIHIQQQQHFHHITHENNLVKIDSPSHSPIQIQLKPDPTNPTNPFSPQSNPPNQPFTDPHNHPIQPSILHQSQSIQPSILHQSQSIQPSILHQSHPIQPSASPSDPSQPSRSNPKPTQTQHPIQSPYIDQQINLQLPSIILKLQHLQQQQRHQQQHLEQPQQQQQRHHHQPLEQPQHQQQRHHHQLNQERNYNYDDRDEVFDYDDFHERNDDFYERDDDFHERDDDFYERDDDFHDYDR